MAVLNRSDKYLIGHQILERESHTLELKQSLCEASFEKCKRTINAFMNGKGGRILFGIRDNGFVQGISLTPKEEDKWRLRVDQYITCPVYPEMVECKVYDVGNYFKVFEILVHPPLAASTKSRQPHLDSQGNSYIRRNASTIKHGHTPVIVKERYDKLQAQYNQLLKEKQQADAKLSSFEYEKIAKDELIQEKTSNIQHLETTSLVTDQLLRQAISAIQAYHTEKANSYIYCIVSNVNYMLSLCQSSLLQLPFVGKSNHDSSSCCPSLFGVDITL